VSTGLWSPRPRAALFFLALPLQLIAAGLSGYGFLERSPVLLLTGMFFWIAWFVLLFAVAVPATDSLGDRGSSILRIASLVVAIILLLGAAAEVTLLVATAGPEPEESRNSVVQFAADGFAKGHGYHDSTALTHQAVDTLLSGGNPYEEPNIVTAIETYGLPTNRFTPLRRGAFADSFPYPSDEQLAQVWDRAPQNRDDPPEEFESRFNYPAGMFLIPAPFMALGIRDLRIVFLIIIVPALAYVIVRLRPNRRLLFIVAVLCSLELSNSIASGETGTMVFPLLLLAWILLAERPWICALLVGVAVATKQTAWFYAPFVVIRIWQEHDTRRSLGALGVIGAIFLAVNLPFVIVNPANWFWSVFGPMTDPMFPHGVGLVCLVTSGVIGLQSSLPFTILELLVFGGGIVWYTLQGRRYPHAGPILAILPLFVAWRSMWPYFFYAGLIMLGGVLHESPVDRASRSLRSKLNLLVS
jgi:hypothetical protein